RCLDCSQRVNLGANCIDRGLDHRTYTWKSDSLVKERVLSFGLMLAIEYANELRVSGVIWLRSPVSWSNLEAARLSAGMAAFAVASSLMLNNDDCRSSIAEMAKPPMSTSPTLMPCSLLKVSSGASIGTLGASACRPDDHCQANNPSSIARAASSPSHNTSAARLCDSRTYRYSSSCRLCDLSVVCAMGHSSDDGGSAPIARLVTGQAKDATGNAEGSPWQGVAL